MTGKTQKTPMEIAAGLLSRRAHGRAELRRKLLDRGFSRHEAEAALDECARLGFLDDKEFASASTEEMKGRGCGPRKIKSSLLRKGVDSDTVEEALKSDAGFTAASETEAACEALRRKLKSLEREPDLKKRKLKALRFLASRGFSPSASFEAVSKAGIARS